MKYSALVPVKSLYEAKSRLAPHLSRGERRQLVIQMLHHVLHILQTSKQFERINVVSPDSDVLTIVQTWGLYPIAEEQPGHNPALRAAALHERNHGIDALLTISADLPLLRTEEIATMLQAACHYHVVLAASHEGTGTNAVLMRPPLSVPYVFGASSLQRYQQEAQQRHLTSTIIYSQGLSADIDTIADLNNWKQEASTPITLLS